MGKSAQDTWPEIWPEIGPMWEKVWQNESIGLNDFRLRINRYGYHEDSPVRDEHSAVTGVLVTYAETTGAVAR